MPRELGVGFNVNLTGSSNYIESIVYCQTKHCSVIIICARKETQVRSKNKLDECRIIDVCMEGMVTSLQYFTTQGELALTNNYERK